MGAWGSGSFENDDALDWLGEFSDAPSTELIKDALTKVADFKGDYLELPECGAAVAAGEIVAALKGAPNPELPDDMKEWVTAQAKSTYPELSALSLKALERIKADSEMKELWEEAGGAGEWYAAIDDLQSRLQAE